MNIFNNPDLKYNYEGNGDFTDPFSNVTKIENTNAAKELPTVLTFGENNEWAVHHDDGCLIFHPQWNTNPHKTSIWIWKEAWEFVQNQGGFDRLVARLRDIKSRLELKNLIDTSS